MLITTYITRSRSDTDSDIIVVLRAENEIFPVEALKLPLLGYILEFV